MTAEYSLQRHPLFLPLSPSLFAYRICVRLRFSAISLCSRGKSRFTSVPVVFLRSWRGHGLPNEKLHRLHVRAHVHVIDIHGTNFVELRVPMPRYYSGITNRYIDVFSFVRIRSHNFPQTNTCTQRDSFRRRRWCDCSTSTPRVQGKTFDSSII